MPTVLAVAAVLALSWVLLVRLVGPIRFYQDDWSFIGHRNRFSVDAIFMPHSGHPSMIPALSFLIGFRFFGLGDLRYYKTVLVLAHMGMCAAVARRVWRRHGPLAALATWSTLCFLGAGAENFVWLFQIGLILSVFFFVLACDAFDRLQDGGRRRDAVAVSGYLCCSMMCSMVGFAAVASIGAVILLSRERRRYCWIPAVPLGLFAVWWRMYDPVSAGQADLAQMMNFLWSAVRTSGAAVLLGNEILGVALVVAIFGLVIRWWLRDRGRPAVLAGFLFVGAFWSLTTLGRSEVYTIVGELSPQRFRYVAAAGLVVAVSDLVPVSREWRLPLVRGAVLVALAAGTVWSGHDNLIGTRNAHARAAVSKAAELSVIDAHLDAFPPEMPVWVIFEPLATVGDYRTAVETTKSTAGLNARQLADLPDGLQSGAENLMLPLLTLERSRFSDCAGVDVTGEAIDLAPGVPVTLAVDREATVVASRWLPPNEGGLGRHVLGRGTWVIGAPVDSLKPDWSLLLGADARTIKCDG